VREATDGWRKLHTKELHTLYFWSQVIRVTKSKMVSKAYDIIIHVKPRGKRPLGVTSHRYENNIKKGIRERESEGADWHRSGSNVSLMRSEELLAHLSHRGTSQEGLCPDLAPKSGGQCSLLRDSDFSLFRTISCMPWGNSYLIISFKYYQNNIWRLSHSSHWPVKRRCYDMYHPH
jgi:hypothetical protein